MFTIPAKPESCTWITTAPNNAQALEFIAADCTDEGVLRHGVTVDVIIGRARTRYTEVFPRGSRVEVGTDGHAYLVAPDSSHQIHTAVITAVHH